MSNTPISLTVDKTEHRNTRFDPDHGLLGYDHSTSLRLFITG